MFDGEVSARPANKIPDWATFDELEAVAECVALTHESVYLNLTGGQSKLESNNFVQSDFLQEHDGDSGFADINAVSPDHLPVARIHTDVDLEFEPRGSAGVHKWPRTTSRE